MRTLRALVVFESLYGNTARVAEEIVAGLVENGVDATVVPIDAVALEEAAGVDLLVVGGPTHAHGMSNAGTRKTAATDTKNVYATPTVAPGLRTWLDETLPAGDGRPAAAFDTRIHAPLLFTGAASKGVAKRLEHHGYHLVAPPESFLVAKDNTLDEGEPERARTWAASVAGALGAR
jgi:flavodoxin